MSVAGSGCGGFWWVVKFWGRLLIGLSRPWRKNEPMTGTRQLLDFGQSLTANKSVVDNPDDAYNPPLIKHLANEMIRVKFNLKEFLRIVYNTQTYQREAVAVGDATFWFIGRDDRQQLGCGA